ncbi:MAG: prolipoprotein diacylglyceryl transferase [Candidatus Aminicenantes bacterium]|nr:MAG: prolipoprotein diacylglyceryl transferase [Candidatus Aminicenantes bacterium]
MYPVIHILHFELESYIVLYLIAFIVATFLLKYELKRNNYPSYLYALLMIVGLITGIIGSKIYYIFEIWNEFILSPVETFFNIPGLGWYGGFILGGISIVLTLKIKKLPVLETLDVMIPIVPLGQALGRLGCFLGGCCHGTPTNVPWALAFPNGQYPPSVTVHPTQLYEMLIYLCIFILLWKLRKKEMKNGLKFSLYLILAGLGRFIVEFYRINPQTALFRLTAPQIIAILGMMLGAFIIIYVKRKGAAWA